MKWIALSLFSFIIFKTLSEKSELNNLQTKLDIAQSKTCPKPIEKICPICTAQKVELSCVTSCPTCEVCQICEPCASWWELCSND
jgi:hypothetical protein